MLVARLLFPWVRVISFWAFQGHNCNSEKAANTESESDTAEAIIQESEREGEPAKQFLEDVQLTFPQVLRVIKTKQVTYSILLQLSEYVQNLEKSGLLETKEMNELHDAVQIDLKKLLRNPPLVKMPSISEILSSHPFLGALPSNIRQALGNTVEETMIKRRVPLYTEGSKPDGIWLIANGVVQWKSKHIANKHPLHSTFSHGSTLGLYEALTGRSRLCDLISDSVESAMVVAKLLLPQQFEEMSMQEMRALVLERSMMHTYLRGEMIEILPYNVAILLEGFVKHESRDESIASPSALVPSCTEYHLISAGSRQGSAAHQGTFFEADSRSRIIIFDLRSIHSERHLRRASASLLSHGLLIPSRRSYEHEGLVSWPDKQYTVGEPADNEFMKRERGLSKRLSARAIHLSVFGSMVNEETYTPRRSFWREPRGTRYRLRSYPSARSHIRKYLSLSALPSAQSEKGATVRRKLKSQGSIASGRFSIHPRPPIARVRRPTTADDSSEGSDAEDEHIVRIDSASNLFRH